MDGNRRVDWNIRRGTRASSPSRAGRRQDDRTPGEVQVHFSDDLDQNLQVVLETLHDLHKVTRDEISVAMEKAFEEELPDPLSTGSEEERDWTEEAVIAEAFDAVMEVWKEMSPMSFERGQSHGS